MHRGMVRKFFATLGIISILWHHLPGLVCCGEHGVIYLGRAVVVDDIVLSKLDEVTVFQSWLLLQHSLFLLIRLNVSVLAFGIIW